MSEKRFVVFIESKDTCQLYDEETHCFYEIHDSARNVDILCERLNELSTENRQLKEENDKLKKNKKILDFIKKRHNCSNCVKTIENNNYCYCLKHYKEVTEDGICEDYKYWK